MHFIVTIVIGLIVGLIARAIVPGKQSLGVILTIILGIAGSFVGAWLVSIAYLYNAGQYADWIGSIVGAVIVLLVWGVITKKSS